MRLVEEELQKVIKDSNSITSAVSVCPALLLAACQKVVPPKPDAPSGVFMVNLKCSEIMNVSDNTNESQRKRQFTDEDGLSILSGPKRPRTLLTH